MRILLFLSFLIPSALLAQGKYFKIDELQFDSPVEEKLLRAALASEEVSLPSFLAIVSEDSLYFDVWDNRFLREMEELKLRKPAKKLEKDVKYIYDALHATFLTKYEQLAFFDQIFETGVYNCVTAVGLYALSFETLGIPYNIKETPQHVYIVADPDGSQLLIETTDPISGFKNFSPGFKEHFVTQLGELKLINQLDIAKKGVSGVFDEFYFGGNDLTLKQLIGIQYYNKGISYLQENDFESSLKELSKAQLFYSSRQIDDLLFLTIASLLSSSDYQDWHHITLLPYLSRFESQNVKKSNVVGEFYRMINAVLIDRNDLETADKAYQYFISQSDDVEINSEVTFSYFYEKSVIDYNRAKYQDAFENIIQAYACKPGHANAESLLGESFKYAYRNKSVDEALARLDTVMSKNIELQNNNKLNTMRLNLYLSKIGEDFDSKKAVSGNQMMSLFENQINANPDYIYDDYLLGNAYSKAAIYYFKKGYSTKARGIIQTGLKYSPNNYELKSRLRMLNN